MTLTIFPRYSETIKKYNRNILQLESLLGQSNLSIPHNSVLIRSKLDCTSRILCTRTLLDLLTRLDPLVRRLGLETPDNRLVIGDLSARFPIEISESEDTTWDCAISIGENQGTELSFDADGWTVYFGHLGGKNNESNPIGPLAGACLGAGDVFKRLVKLNFPDNQVSKRMVLADSYRFSTLSYSNKEDSLPISEFNVDATVIGAGGIFAGFVSGLTELNSAARGKLKLVDPDVVKIENLNRLTYAKLDEATGEAQTFKVLSATKELMTKTNLDVEPVATDFTSFKKSLDQSRSNRKYSLIVSTVDNDEARREIQLDLPYDLLDAGTGLHSNCRIERISFLDGECLGCRIALQPQIEHPVEPPRAEGDQGDCGRIENIPAPSLSFLSFFPGVLLAGELAKRALDPSTYLRGYFEHIFLYPPNPDNKGEVAKTNKCVVECKHSSMIQSFKAKYVI